MRGSLALRRLDALLAPVILAVLAALARVRRLAGRRRARRTSERPEDQPTVVVCFGAIGDLLLVGHALRARGDRGRVGLLCTSENAAAAALFPEVFGSVTRVDLRRPWTAARHLEAPGPVEIIDTTQWANIGPLVCGVLKVLFPGARVRGFRVTDKVRNHLYDELVEHSSSHHEIENFGRLLHVPATVDLMASVPEPRTLVADRSPRVAVHMWPAGHRSYLKEWPESHWVALCQRLTAAGCELLATGGPSDAERTAAFVTRSQLPITNLAGRTTLGEMSSMFGGSIDLCVSVNTGTMHLAALAGTRVISLNGPTSSTRWGPLGRGNLNVVPRAQNVGYLDYGFEYPDADVDAASLHLLSVDEVFDASRRLLGLVGPGGEESLETTPV